MVLIKYNVKCGRCGLTLGLITGKSDYSYNLKCLGCGDHWFHSIYCTTIIITWDDNTVFKLYDI